jgi:hypothetical protein
MPGHLARFHIALSAPPPRITPLAPKEHALGLPRHCVIQGKASLPLCIGVEFRHPPDGKFQPLADVDQSISKAKCPLRLS